MGMKFDNKQYHQKLKHNYYKDKVGDPVLLLSKTMTIYSAFMYRSRFRKNKTCICIKWLENGLHSM